MRTGTIVVLLGLIVLFAFFGIKAFGWLLAFFLLVIVLGLGAVFVGLWVIKRRMRRKLEELGHVLEQRFRQHETASSRNEAIDVDAQVRKPRDGADDPERP